MNRLTPWSNDPVTDPPGEVVYLRDEKTGEFWSPTPAPRGGEATTVVRHGQGYSRFTQTSHGLEQDLLVLISPTDPVKMVRLGVRNTGRRPRRLSATFYAEWVLGGLRDHAALAGGVLGRRGNRRVVRHQRLGGRLRRGGRFRRRSRDPRGHAAALVHDRSGRVPRPRGLSGSAGRPWPVAAFRPVPANWSTRAPH